MGARTREDIDKDNAQRMQRVSLWVARADAPRTMTPHIANVDDAAIRFIFYWIAFESAFAVKVSTDNARMEKFINDAVGMDALAFGGMLRTNNRHAMMVMELPVTHEGFWQRNNMKTHAAWRRQFDRELEEFLAADVAAKLCVLFRRLRVIRNHIFHGASSPHHRRQGPVGVVQDVLVRVEVVGVLLAEERAHPVLEDVEQAVRHLDEQDAVRLDESAKLPQHLPRIDHVLEDVGHRDDVIVLLGQVELLDEALHDIQPPPLAGELGQRMGGLNAGEIPAPVPRVTQKRTGGRPDVQEVAVGLVLFEERHVRPVVLVAVMRPAVMNDLPVLLLVQRGVALVHLFGPMKARAHADELAFGAADDAQHLALGLDRVDALTTAQRARPLDDILRSIFGALLATSNVVLSRLGGRLAGHGARS